jgi:murein DD-endopeptidase MepM/ murein hydrolase activator NlpD
MAIMFSRPPREGAGCCETPWVRRHRCCRAPEDHALPTTSIRRTPAIAAASVLVAALGVGVWVAPVAAKPTSGAAKLQQLITSAAALKVQLNLAVASDNAVKAELARLQRLVGSEQAVVAADRSAAAAADAAVAAAGQRLTELEAQGRDARAALVDRAIDLYEHPYQLTEALLSGTGSLQDLTDRQVLADAVQSRTSDLVDAVRHEQIQLRAASHDLAVAQAVADARHQASTAEFARLQTALGSQQKVHDALEARIHDDDSQLAVLQPEIGFIIKVSEARYAAQIAALEAANPGIDPVLGPVGSFGLEWPIAGPVTQEFGHTGHPGIDIAAAYGTPIHAAGTGVVIFAGWEGGYGNYTCISHGGPISTCYGHQSAIYVTVGQTVSRGQIIGAEGSTGYSTGPHVHFEVRVDGAVRNPLLFIPGNP